MSNDAIPIIPLKLSRQMATNALKQRERQIIELLFSLVSGDETAKIILDTTLAEFLKQESGIELRWIDEGMTTYTLKISAPKSLYDQVLGAHTQRAEAEYQQMGGKL